MINDLLDFSKIEAGKLELDPAEFSLRHVLGETLRSPGPRAHKKGLELVCQIQPDVPDALIGDAGRLRQILLNLVGNAIKFTEEGEVVVRIEAGPTGAGRPLAGGPIRPSQVFASRSATRASASRSISSRRSSRPSSRRTTRRPAGMAGRGLGLSIATRLVALMGGDDRRRERAGPGQYVSISRRDSASRPTTRPAAGAATG